MKLSHILLSGALCLSSLTIDAQNPNREFRGAWLHTVFQSQYKKQSTDENKAYLRSQLDSLQMLGINAVIFQVRPQADAFYPSKLEPWSCYLTDGGKAPNPKWDPLQFMIDECHARGMELHAWLNPYRVTASKNQNTQLPASHIFRRHPDRFVTYDGKLYFDPGIPENRKFICDVVADIVSRYDVDGIHFDDYFYPYPVAKRPFPDDKSYRKYGNGMPRDDWRRRNVDLLIKELHERITGLKPWVRFGISPFGIFRNKKSDPKGSNTNGLENYDSLYANVLLWEQQGWIDYLLPQLYWELEHKSASYSVLVDWWNDNAGQNRHLYIGQDVARTMTKPDLAPSTQASQLKTKIEMTRKADNIQGNCWWPGYSLCKNVGGIADSLQTKFQATPALVPAYTWMSDSVPEPVKGLRPTSDNTFSWDSFKTTESVDDVVKYAIYRFDHRDDIDLERAGALTAITYTTSYTATIPGVYVVTALNRANNESEPSQAIIIR